MAQRGASGSGGTLSYLASDTLASVSAALDGAGNGAAAQLSRIRLAIETGSRALAWW